MRSIYLVLFFLILNVTKSVGQFHLNGTIHQADSRYIFLKHTDSAMHWVKDSALIVDTKFSFTGSVNVYTQLGLLYLDSAAENNRVRIPLENAHLNIDVEEGEFSAFQFSGSPSWADYKAIQHVIDSLFEQRNFFDSLLSDGKTTAYNKARLNDASRGIIKVVLDGVIKNNNANISPVLLWENRTLIGHQKVKQYFNLLSDYQKGSNYGLWIKKAVEHEDSLISNVLPEIYLRC